MCYAANLLAFDPKPTGPATGAATGLAKGSLNEAMPDGTSNTICFAHRYKICSGESGTTQNLWWANPGQGPGPKQGPFFGFGDYRQPQPEPFTPPEKSAMLVGITSGASFTFGSQGGAAGTGVPFQVTPEPDTCHQNLTQSPHPGVMVVGLGDGSTRTVNESISTIVWMRACHPWDGSPLGAW